MKYPRGPDLRGMRDFVQGGGIAYGTKEGRLRVLTHIGRPLAKVESGMSGNSRTRLEDELLAASHEAGPDSSDDD